MSASVLVYLTPSSEKIEVVTTIDLLVRGGIKIITASTASDGNLTITYSRGVKPLADVPLVEMTGGKYDVIVLPGGIKGAECFHDSTLLIETVRRFYHSGRITVAICAASATVLIPHDILPTGNMTGFPTPKDEISVEQRQDKRVVWDTQVRLLTSQGPGTAVDSGLKITGLLAGREKVHEMTSQPVIAAGVYNYYEQCRMR